jgi:hypothetical protein
MAWFCGIARSKPGNIAGLQAKAETLKSETNAENKARNF